MFSDTLCEGSNFDGLEIIESEIPKLKETRRNVEMTINELLENGLSKQVCSQFVLDTVPGMLV